MKETASINMILMFKKKYISCQLNLGLALTITLIDKYGKTKAFHHAILFLRNFCLLGVKKTGLRRDSIKIS
jgi:hypothetical protein